MPCASHKEFQNPNFKCQIICYLDLVIWNSSREVRGYSLSSGEQRGKSPNHSFVPHCVRPELKRKSQNAKLKATTKN